MLRRGTRGESLFRTAATCAAAASTGAIVVGYATPANASQSTTNCFNISSNEDLHIRAQIGDGFHAEASIGYYTGQCTLDIPSTVTDGSRFRAKNAAYAVANPNNVLCASSAYTYGSGNNVQGYRQTLDFNGCGSHKYYFNNGTGGFLTSAWLTATVYSGVKWYP